MKVDEARCHGEALCVNLANAGLAGKIANRNDDVAINSDISHLCVSASAIDARYSQAFTNGTTPVADGNKLPGIPQHFLFGELLWSGARLDVARPTRLGTQAGVELVRAGRLYANDTNVASADGYTVFHLKASHGWAVGKGNLTAYARVDNVGDKAYVGSVIVNQAASQFYEPAPGRNWTLGARLNVPL